MQAAQPLSQRDWLGDVTAVPWVFDRCQSLWPCLLVFSPTLVHPALQRPILLFTTPCSGIPFLFLLFPLLPCIAARVSHHARSRLTPSQIGVDVIVVVGQATGGEATGLACLLLSSSLENRRGVDWKLMQRS
jgi:hypothetical protein